MWERSWNTESDWDFSAPRLWPPSLTHPRHTPQAGTVRMGRAPRDSPGKNTAVGCHSLLYGIFPTQGSDLCLFCLLLAGRFFTADTTWEAPSGTLSMSSIAQSCPTRCSHRDCHMPSFPVHHQLPACAQTLVH